MRKRIFALAWVFSCLGVPGLQAQVRVDKSVVTLTTPSLEATFQGANLRSLKNRLSGEESILRPGPGWMDLNLQTPPTEMLAPSDWRLEPGGTSAVLELKDASRTARIQVGIDSATQEITLRFSGQSEKPGVRSMLFGLQGFDPQGGRFLIPGQAGIVFDEKTTPGYLGLEYPTHWEAQFAVYERASGGVLIYARDPKLYFKRLQASRQFGTLDLGLEVFAIAPWGEAKQVPELEWRFQAYEGSWTKAVDAYRKWSDSVMPRRNPAEKADASRASGGTGWQKDIQLVVTMVDTVVPYLEPLAARVDPTKTLIYLINWRRDPYDVNYPDYTPNGQVKEFIEKAHELGFHVILHTNALGVAVYNPAFLKVFQYQMRDPEKGEFMYWPQGLWPGGSFPPFYIQSFAFISPCASEYRKLLIESLRPAIEELKPDGLHLDAGGVMLNDGGGLIEGMTSVEGMVRLHQDLNNEFPDLLFSFESMTEGLAGIQNFAQRWPSTYPGHPISTYLLGDRIHFYSFLNQPPPSTPAFLNYISRYEPQGIVPSYHVAQPKDLDGTDKRTELLVKLQTLWQKHAFEPDWSGDWSGVIFRWRSADGSVEAVVEEKANVVQLRVGHEVLYERVRGVTHLETDRLVKDWPAYDGARILGLNPAREYWLDKEEERPTDRVHLTSLPDDVVLGLDSYSGKRYGYFELDRLPRPTIDFLQKFSRGRLGTSYNRQDVAYGYGSFIDITRSMVGGRVVEPVVMMQPPYRLAGGVTFLEFPVDVPASKPVLKFQVGISDFATGTDGVLLLVRINGQDAWRAEIGKGPLTPVAVDLSPWAGQTVQLRLMTHAGMRLNATADLAVWADLNIEEEPQSREIQLAVAIPQAAGDRVSGAGESARSGVKLVEEKVLLPAKLVYFTAEQPEIARGQSLTTFPFERFRSGYGGWPIPSEDGVLGRIQPGKSGGVTYGMTVQTHPPPNGLSIVTWGVKLPVDAQSLEFYVSFADPSPPLPPEVQYSPTEVRVRVNGETVWKETIELNGWKRVRADISKWAGKNAIMEISADALGQGSFNWVQWAGLTVW